MLNPYSFAFVGLLAGLFTERGHALLAYLVDQMVERVQSAMEAQSAARPRPNGSAEHTDPGNGDAGPTMVAEIPSKRATLPPRVA